MIVDKTLDSQEIMQLVREALENRGYNVSQVELEWQSPSLYYNGYVKAQVKLDV